MFKLKKAFSLVEILIVMAIISVVLVMCFSITNRTLDKAYTRYIYTGYEGLSDAIQEVNAHNISISIASGFNSEYMRSICNLFDGTIDSSNPLLCRIPNGVEYMAVPNIYSETSTSPENIALFVMSVPSRKTNLGAAEKDSTILAYFINGEPNVLMPVNESQELNDGLELRPTLNLQERSDLLPFYVDNGRSGRTVNESDSTNSAYVRRTFLTAKDAFCSVYGSKSIYALNAEILSCGNIQPQPSLGVVWYKNPQKVW